MDEKDLIQRLKARDEAAFNTLVLRHQGQVFNLCYRMLNDAAEAEDIAQETFVKCFRAISAFRGEAAIGTWLYRIAVNLCKNRIKYLGRRHHGSIRDVAALPEAAVVKGASIGRTVGEPAARPDQALEGRQAEQRVQKALGSLDPGFRELLVLRDVQGLRYAEVMRITGLAEGTVKSRLHRARAALKRAYQTLEGS